MTNPKETTNVKPPDTPPTSIPKSSSPRYFDYSLISHLFQGLPEGAISLTPINFKFTNPSDTLIGVYMGYTKHASTYASQSEFTFHKLALPTGAVVGFCGTSKLDQILCNIPVGKYEVHIVYNGDEALEKGKKIKNFTVIARHFSEKIYELLPSTEEIKDNTKEIPF